MVKTPFISRYLANDNQQDGGGMTHEASGCVLRYIVMTIGQMTTKYVHVRGHSTSINWSIANNIDEAEVPW